MKAIALVGAGKLGSRHLQALLNISSIDTKISVVDKSEEAIELAKKLLKNTCDIKKANKVAYYKNIDLLPEENLDLVIIATTAEHRLQVLKNIASKAKIQFIIFEKFLFQKIADFEKARNILDENNIVAWVNLPRREWPFYKDVKSWAAFNNITCLEVTGSRWSIATSAIHFIDLCAYMADDLSLEIEAIDMDGGLVDAYSVVTGNRLGGLKEFYGAISGVFRESGIRFSLRCSDGDEPFRIRIKTIDECIEIFEESGAVSSTTTFEIKKISVPYQSELTNQVVEKIFMTGDCNLPRYTDSAELHAQLLKNYCEAFGRYDANFLAKCPIT